MVHGQHTVLRSGVQSFHENGGECVRVPRVDDGLDLVFQPPLVHFEPVGVGKGRIGKGRVRSFLDKGGDELRVDRDHQFVAIVVAACVLCESAASPSYPGVASACLERDAPDKIEQSERSPLAETTITSKQEAYSDFQTPRARCTSQG